MSFFETLLVLMLAAVLLLQVSRRLGLPYPAMLALAGALVAFVPGTPTIHIDPAMALELFIAPVLLDAAYDFPVRTARRLWRPLFVLTVFAVLVTAAVVGWIGWMFAGLPLAAAIVLGAIVAPPDAAAATAVLSQVTLPRRTVAVLRGESLFNDATALLLFTGALAIQSDGGLTRAVAVELALAVPGGILLGIGLGLVMRRLGHFVAGTLGGSMLQFLNAFLVWIVAERLHLSAVLAVVACAMTVARPTDTGGSARNRVHSYALWATVVFLLNVLAFLLMGMQARTIVVRLGMDRIEEAVTFAGLVILGVIVSRFVVVLGWNWLARRHAGVRGDLPPPTGAQGLLVSWSGMRGLLSLATAFALPADFPQRDLVVLTAFGVVLATLVVQGLTMAPLIRLLKLDDMEDAGAELADARQTLIAAAIERLAGEEGGGADMLRDFYELKGAAPHDPEAKARLRSERELGLAVITRQREVLERLRDEQEIGTDSYYQLQEEIDWRELTLLPEHRRRMEEV